jgi:biotin transport system substrate-specific component
MKASISAPSMLDFALPKENLATDILAVFLGSLFLVLGSQVSIPLPFTPVPITGQTFSVLVMGSMLGAKRAPLSVLLYIFYGIFGLPVFADKSSGVSVLMGATGGYIFGFVICAYVGGKFAEKNWDRTFWKSMASMTVSQAFIFILGCLWLIPYVGPANILEKGFYPFVIVGIVKTLLAGSTTQVGWLLLKKWKGN